MTKLFLAPTTLPDAAPLAFIEAAAQAGYDGLGLRLNRSPVLPFHPMVGNAALIRDVKRALADCGLPVLDILSFYLDPDTDVAAFAPALALGGELGGKYAMIVGNDPDWARLADNFGRLCDLAAGFGIAIAIEFVPLRPLATLALATRLIAEAGRDNAVLCFDPFHFVRGGGQVSDLAALSPRLVPYVQLSDGVLQADPAKRDRMDGGMRRIPGEGVLPLREILAALPSGLPISIEAPNSLDEPMSDKAWAKHALDATRKFLAEG